MKGMKEIRAQAVAACASFFYVGFFPLAPGSLASCVGLLLAIILSESSAVYIGVWIVITCVGFIVSGKMELLMQEKDPSCIVIDEVSGILIAVFMLPLYPAVLVTAFFLFRAFDMFKIYPVQKFEALPGGVGVMMDDIVAGIYANLIMHAALLVTGLR